MRVATFNVRTPTPLDGANRWARRRDLAAEVLGGVGADCFGLQECVASQAEFLAEKLPAYAWHGVGRDADGGGEMCPVFWRRDRLEKTGGGTFWLSRTPGVPGSRSWLGVWPRLATWCEFRDAGGLAFRLYNTHLSVASPWARSRSADLILNRTAAAGVPCVVTGDFNCRPGSRPHRKLTAALADAGAGAGGGVGTYHGFKGRTTGRRLDWVLVPPAWRADGYRVVTDGRDGRWPSDHFPVVAEVAEVAAE